MIALCRTLLFIVIACAVPLSAAARDWGADRFEVEIGEVTARDGALTAAPDAKGRVLLSLPLAAPLTLHHDDRIALDFSGAPPVEIFVMWHNESEPQTLHQRSFRPGHDSAPVLEMRGVDGWEGLARSLQLGFYLPAGHNLHLRRVTLQAPGAARALHDAWAGWTAFRPWRQSDINAYSGTARFDRGPYPVPVCAGLLLALLVVYFVWRGRAASVRGAGVILLCVWMALDALWQLRLWRQVDRTVARYGGKTPAAKVQASADAAIASLAAGARGKIADPAARVFIASQSDGAGMRGAYYMSPLNTWWSRGGPELPAARYLRPGDYILLLSPTRAAYDRAGGRLRYRDAAVIAVAERYADRSGVLLEVR